MELTQLRQQRVAIHIRHLDVGDHQIGFGFQRLGAVLGDDNIVVSENIAKKSSYGLLIIDDENSAIGRRRELFVDAGLCRIHVCPRLLCQ